MARLLFVVEDTFFIKGRGLVLVPGIVPQGEERIGDTLVFKRPDGSHLKWTIGGFEMIHCTPPKQTTDMFIVLKGLNQDDVPIGSEVWSIDA